MSSKVSRRNFLVKGAQACVGSCALFMLPKLPTYGTSINLYRDDEVPVPKLLNYCGYKCPADCKLLTASVENDAVKKKEAYEIWKMKENYGIEFEPDKIYCYGCKSQDKPAGVVISNCTVRKCAMEKKYECCIECKDLTNCTKELWTKFPDFKKSVIEIQAKYLKALEAN